MKFGAHLYGTATLDSDVDYKGIFMPSKDEVLLGRIPKSHSHSTGQDESKNTENDTDVEIYSFHSHAHEYTLSLVLRFVQGVCNLRWWKCLPSDRSIWSALD